MSGKDSATIKYRVLQVLEHYIYGPSKEKLERRLAAIIKKNPAAPGVTQAAFYYRGKRWSLVSFRGLPKIGVLDESMHAEMDSYLAESEELEKERPLIIAYIRKILNSHQTIEDALVHLPEGLHPPICEAVGIAAERVQKKVSMNFDDAAQAAGVSDASLFALKQRMMWNIMLD